MSRSYKKEPVVKDHSKHKYAKKLANRKVRRKLKNCDYDFPSGKAYRKIYETWDVCDWRFRETYREYETRKRQYKYEYLNGVWRHGFLRLEHDDSENMNYWQWFKFYKRK